MLLYFVACLVFFGRTLLHNNVGTVLYMVGRLPNVQNRSFPKFIFFALYQSPDGVNISSITVHFIIVSVTSPSFNNKYFFCFHSIPHQEGALSLFEGLFLEE